MGNAAFSSSQRHFHHSSNDAAELFVDPSQWSALPSGFPCFAAANGEDAIRIHTAVGSIDLVVSHELGRGATARTYLGVCRCHPRRCCAVKLYSGSTTHSAGSIVIFSEDKFSSSGSNNSNSSTSMWAAWGAETVAGGTEASTAPLIERGSEGPHCIIHEQQTQQQQQQKLGPIAAHNPSSSSPPPPLPAQSRPQQECAVLRLIQFKLLERPTPYILRYYGCCCVQHEHAHRDVILQRPSDKVFSADGSGTHSKAAILTECVNGGTMASFLLLFEWFFSVRHLTLYLRQVLGALHILHSGHSRGGGGGGGAAPSIAHRDVKPHNILVRLPRPLERILDCLYSKMDSEENEPGGGDAFTGKTNSLGWRSCVPRLREWVRLRFFSGPEEATAKHSKLFARVQALLLEAQVVLADFGDAVVVTADHNTAATAFAGTRGYAAPEVLRAWSGGPSSAKETHPALTASDVYSAGALFYCLLTLHPSVAALDGYGSGLCACLQTAVPSAAYTGYVDSGAYRPLPASRPPRFLHFPHTASGADTNSDGSDSAAAQHVYSCGCCLHLRSSCGGFAATVCAAAVLGGHFPTLAHLSGAGSNLGVTDASPLLRLTEMRRELEARRRRMCAERDDDEAWRRLLFVLDGMMAPDATQRLTAADALALSSG